jgi:spore coat polysaccharide biosynthesis protein SpsF (cytidylyltransferase family)
MRMTLDYPEDFIFFKKIIESIDEYSYENILNFLEENSEIKKINFFLDEQWKKNQEKKLGEIIL